LPFDDKILMILATCVRLSHPQFPNSCLQNTRRSTIWPDDWMHRKTARMRVLVKRFLAEMQHRPASWQGIGVARLVDSETTRPPFVREIDERRRRVAAVWGQRSWTQIWTQLLENGEY
jgi:hypothetical protein